MEVAYYSLCVHNTQMLATAILGASGYSGQETLDRVLAHGPCNGRHSFLSLSVYDARNTRRVSSPYVACRERQSSGR